jgi:hypothetical protein
MTNVRWSAGLFALTIFHWCVPIASLMGPGPGGFATVMGPPDRHGHGATRKAA